MSEIYSGYNITLKTIENKAYKGKITKIEGNSEQQIREGYNLLNYTNTEFTPPQSTWYFLDGLSGAYGSNISEKTSVKAAIQAGKTYKVYVGSVVNGNIQIVSENEEILLGSAEILSEGTFVAKADGFAVPRINPTTIDVTTSVKDMMIYEYNGQEKPYEQYGIAPTINFPSEIKSVGDNINIFDENFRQGSWNDTNNTTRIFSTQNAEIEAGTYTFSTNIDTSIYKVAVNSSSKEFPHTDATAFIYDSSWQTIKDITFSTKEKGFLGVGVSRLDGGNLSPEDIKNFYFKLEKGRKATPYSPLRIRKHRDI